MKTINIEEYKIFYSETDEIKIDVNRKKIVNTINAHSYIISKNDKGFKQALAESDILLPDGEGIVLMVKSLLGKKIKKIAGADIHEYLLGVSNKEKLKCFYLGASESTLDLIEKKLSPKYPNIEFGFFSPPFKPVFSEADNFEMLSKVNNFKPNVLFVGMTAPKQEKWVHENKAEINTNIICSIGAVFDFVAETKKRAPRWIVDLKLEWLYRSFTAWRLTKRYLYSTPLFFLEVLKLKFFKKK